VLTVRKPEAWNCYNIIFNSGLPTAGRRLRMRRSTRIHLGRLAAFGLFLAPFTAFGAITSLTPLPPSITLHDVFPNGTVITDSAPAVLAAGSGSANLTVSTTAPWLAAYLSSTSIAAGSSVSVTIAANPSGLTQNGSPYQGQVIVSTGSVSATFNVTFILQGGQEIQLSSTGWDVSVAPGGSQTDIVGFMAGQSGFSTAPTAPGQAAFPINLQPSTVDGNNWLSALQTSNFTFSVTVNPGSLAAGTYSGGVAITGGGTLVPTNFFVTLTVGGGSSQSGVSTTSLSFVLSTGAQPNQQTINVASPSTGSSYFTVTPTITTGGNWLQASPPSGATPQSVTVTATPGSLAPGNYTGNVQIVVGPAVYNVPVSLTLTATASIQAGAAAVSLTASQGGSCTPQSVAIQSSDSTLTLPFTVKASDTTPVSGAWLTASPSSGTTPGSISISCNPAGLLAGNYSGIVTVASADATNTSVNIAVSFAYGSQPTVTTQTISHVADGQGWRSTIILVNTDTVAAPYTVSFWKDTGTAGSGIGSSAFSLVLTPASAPLSGTIPVGGSVTIQTADSDPNNLTEGWAQVTSSNAIDGTAIFRYDPTSQEAAVPLLTSGGKSLEIPYQVGSGFALGVALANPSAQTATVMEITRDLNGNTLNIRTLTIAPMSHFATNPPALTNLTGSGVVEYDSNVSIYGLGIRLDVNAFTSIDAVLPQVSSTKTISHVADGMGWRSSILLVNTGTVAAPYTVNFWKDSGTAGSGIGSSTFSLVLTATSAPLSGTIPIGGSVTIQTADSDPNNLTEGWAQVTSSQSIDGTAIFRYDPTSQEAAVPLLISGGKSLEIPYQVGSGFALGVALANPSAQTATVMEITRDLNGNTLNIRTLTIAPMSHFATNPPALTNLTGSGVVEYDSNVSIYGLGIRLDVNAFTSIDAVYK